MAAEVERRLREANRPDGVIVLGAAAAPGPADDPLEAALRVAHTHSGTCNRQSTVYQLL
jgi:hypothetical protein